ncbi:MAG: hypothetical protein Q9191_001933 [Dirinaria sp. TL-2023a]
MAPRKAPKALLFDIGGVCVLSPLQAIVEFEQKHSIPADWVNFAISQQNPNGAWQRLERGEIKMDKRFFSSFNADLRNAAAWQKFHTSRKKDQGKLRSTALHSPSTLGDPVSLRAEHSETEPTEHDRGARSDEGAHEKPKEKANQIERPEGKSKLRDAALKNPSLLGDPVSLRAENTTVKSESASVPPPEAPAPTPTSLSSEKLSMGENPIYSSSDESSVPPLPPLPNIDGEALFWAMMDHARSPDPYVFPALLRLQSAPASQRPLLGALSNTVIFPPGHPYNRLPSVPASSESTPSSPSSSPSSRSSVSSNDDPRTHFDIFIASAEVGMRKPEPRIYKLAAEKLDEHDKQNGGSGVSPEDILFLDDIGENLKAARDMGMQTIKVQNGKTFRAVKELEAATGLELMNEKTRRAKL